jgi:hypothetical protein
MSCDEPICDVTRSGANRALNHVKTYDRFVATRRPVVPGSVMSPKPVVVSAVTVK